MSLAIFFWASIFLILFSYFGYPLSLRIISIFRRYNVNKKSISPAVSIIICAYNEEKRIKRKLENTAKLIYPRDQLQIIIVSDGSTDKTHQIIEDFKEEKIEIIRIEEHKGKESAQAEAIRKANGEILVFTDVSTWLEKNGLLKIVSNFADPNIGCVSSVDKVITAGDDITGGEGFYVKYEMWLRAMESRVKSVVGLSGSFFAARSEVCQEFSSKMQSDFRTLLNSMKKGLRGISDPETIGYYQDIKDKTKEFNRKVRTVLRGITVFFYHIEFVNVFKYGLFSYMYICHKLLRWVVPFLLLLAFFTGIFLINYSEIYETLFLMQTTFYLFALSGIICPKLNKIIMIKIPSFFVMVNASIMIAWLKYFRGERITLWQSSVR